MTLDKRLYAAASLVRKGSPCVDVGTDHGYLPVYLYESGITTEITACDINQKPLEAAGRTISAHGLSDRIRLLLSDGLEEVSEASAMEVIICGMGGDLILKLLLNSPFEQNADRRFILQPMTNISLLRRELYKNGYEIISEIPIEDLPHYYTVMLVRYSGIYSEVSNIFELVGKIPRHDNSEDREKYIRHIIKREKKIASGLLKSSDKQTQADKHLKAVRELEALIS